MVYALNAFIQGTYKHKYVNMANKINKNMLIISLFAITVIAVSFFYFFLVPRIINIESRRPEIEKALKENVEDPIKLGNLNTSMTWDFKVNISADSITVKHTDNTPFISTGKAFLKISIPELIRKRVEIKEIKVNSLHANITRLENGHFDIEELIPKNKKTRKYKVIFEKSKIYVDDYHVNFRDKSLKMEKFFAISGKLIDIKDLTLNKILKGEISGTIDSSIKPNTKFDAAFRIKLPLNRKNKLRNAVRLKGNIENLYPELFKDYISEYGPHEFKDLTGTARVKFDIETHKNKNEENKVYLDGSLKNIKGVKIHKGVVINFPGVSQFLIDGTVGNEDLKFNKTRFSNKDVNVIGSGIIYKFRTRNKVLDLKFDIKNAKAEKALAVFPSEIKVPRNVVKKLRKYSVKGNVKGNLELKGYYRTPNLYGNIEYDNFSIFNGSKSIPKGSGTVAFTGENIVLNTKTYLNPNGYVIAKGTITPFTKKKLDLRITSNQIDLGYGHKTLMAIRDIIDFKLGPLPLMTMSAQGKVNLRVHGKFKDPHLYGYVQLKNGSGTHTGLASPAHDINGKVIFNNQNIIYDKISGYVHQTKVEAIGYSNIDAFSDVKLILSNVDLERGKVFVDNSSLLKKLKVSLKEIKNPMGTADIEVNLKGHSEDLSSWGKVLIRDGSLNYNGISARITNVNGQLRYNKEKAFFDKLKGNVLGSIVFLEGTAAKDTVNLTISSSDVDLSKVKELVKTSPLLKDADISLKDIIYMSGNAGLIARINGEIGSKEAFQDLEINFKNATIIYRGFDYPVYDIRGKALVTQEQISSNSINARVMDIPVKAHGKLSGDQTEIVPDVQLDIPKFEFSKVLSISKSKIFPKEFYSYAKLFRDYRGNISAKLKLNPVNYIADIKFYKASFIHRDSDLPVQFGSGRLIVTPQELAFNNLYTNIANSSIYLNGKVNNYLKNPDFELLADAKVNSTDIDKYIIQRFNEPICITGIVPVSMIIRGGLPNWNIFAQMTLDKNSNILYKNEIGLPSDRIKVISLKASGNKGNVDVNNLELALGNNPIEVGLSMQTSPSKAITLEQLFFARGSINNLFSKNPTFNNFVAKTSSPVSIKIFNPVIKTALDESFFSDGEFSANLNLQGSLMKPQVHGNIKLNKVNIPSKEILVDFADITLARQHLILTDSFMTIAGSKMQVYADIDDIFEKPALIKSLKILSSSLNIDKISNLYRSMKTSGVNNFSGIPPFIISNGSVNADELIVGNLITTSFSSLFTLTPDWLLSLSSLSFDVADGTATGEVLYNLKNSMISGKFSAKDMQANAAATTLFRLPNEVYGTLNGNVQFTTKGNSAEQFISNANGTADFKIIDGRLVRLGSLEYLLRAVNVLQSGIGGLNINSIIDLIVPQKTGYFDLLEGSVVAKDGILKTDNISTKGKNLSLALSGDIDMITNNANITVLGKVSKKVTGLLGPLGSVSINTFIDFIPGLGFLPSTPNKGLLDIIPGLSRIPGLGIGGGKFRRFVVKIEGDLYNPTSVKSFRWLD